MSLFIRLVYTLLVKILYWGSKKPTNIELGINAHPHQKYVFFCKIGQNTHGLCNPLVVLFHFIMMMLRTVCKLICHLCDMNAWNWGLQNQMPNQMVSCSYDTLCYSSQDVMCAICPSWQADTQSRQIIFWQSNISAFIKILYMIYDWSHQACLPQ